MDLALWTYATSQDFADVQITEGFLVLLMSMCKGMHPKLTVHPCSSLYVERCNAPFLRELVAPVRKLGSRISWCQRRGRRLLCANLGAKDQPHGQTRFWESSVEPTGSSFFARGGDLICLCTHDQLHTKKLAYQQLKKGELPGGIQNLFLPIFMQLSQHFCDICLAALRNILCQLRNKNCRITVTVYTSCPHHTLLYCCGNLL